jgi:hypothetical protein
MDLASMLETAAVRFKQANSARERGRIIIFAIAAAQQ